MRPSILSVDVPAARLEKSRHARDGYLRVHALVQLVSNGSRLALFKRHVRGGLGASLPVVAMGGGEASRLFSVILGLEIPVSKKGSSHLSEASFRLI